MDADQLFRDAARRQRRGEFAQAASRFIRAAAASKALAAKVRTRLEQILRQLDRRLGTRLTPSERKKTLALRRRLRTWMKRARPRRPTPRSTRIPGLEAGRAPGAGRARPRHVLRKKAAAPKRKALKTKLGAARAPAQRGSFGPLSRGMAAPKPADTRTSPEPIRAPEALDTTRTLRAPEAADARIPPEPMSAPARAPEVELEQAADLVRRTPHMEFDYDRDPSSALMPDTTPVDFWVSVYLDTEAARAGEDTIDVVVPDRTEVIVLLLTSEHFIIASNLRCSLFITADQKRIGPVRYHLLLKPKHELPIASPPSIIALFFHDGRPVGKVSRSPVIEGVATAPPPTASARLEIEAAQAADLVITIVESNAHDGRQFFCTVRTPLLDGFVREVSEPWNLPSVTQVLVRAYMDRFTARNLTSGQLIAELKGAGIQLFQASPKIFQKAFWQLVDSGKSFGDIAIVSEEPFIPWELMIPCRVRDGRTQKWDEPLGVKFRIGRWIAGDIVSPRQKISLVDSYVIAPQYTGNLALQLSAAEIQLVLAVFTGNPIQPASFEEIERQLNSQGRTLLHFVCHGKDNAGGLQTIYLENKEELSSTTILGMQGLSKAFAEKRPLVFLNACEVGRTTAALMGLGGFAKSFIDLGASAVIAPLWSVKDKIAHEVAKEFYQHVKNEPDKPFAEILRDLRAKAYQSGAEDTYAAYCFYGDPRASASRPQPN
jgi:hypothetical protein